MSQGVTAQVNGLFNTFSDWRGCVMFQGTAGSETLDTRSEAKNSENHQDDDGEAFLIFSLNLLLLSGRKHVFYTLC